MMNNKACNYTLMCDFYELTMCNGYFQSDLIDTITYFDVFFRDVPDRGGFAIFAGLQQIVQYIQELSFSNEDIAYLASKNTFSKGFLDYLRTFKFQGDVWSVPEGTPIFPNEPVMVFRAKAIEAQFIETYVLSVFNHMSLIATKSNRIVRAAEGRAISEFGARRAHGAEAAYLGARAAYIGGCHSTSNTLAGRRFGIPVVGTMAHSWVQMFEDEYASFVAYCKAYPENAVLLVDTYDILKSGVPNAIKAFDEVLKPLGKRPRGIRLDSGDMAYYSKKARIMLDEAGYPDAKIVVSNSLDEYLIRDLIFQGAKIDLFGVGERLITSKSSPVFGGVYKLTAIEDSDGQVIPKIKVSENPDKITTPHFKRLYRLYEKENNKAIADYITVYDETIDSSKPLELFDPLAIWKRKIVDNFVLRELHVPIFQNGKLVYTLPTIEEVRSYTTNEVASIWDEVTRFENPHNYYVDLSQKLWDIKQELLQQNRFK